MIKLKEATVKSKSQSLRSVLYLRWQVEAWHMTEEEFYNQEMDKIIEREKEKL